MKHNSATFDEKIRLARKHGYKKKKPKKPASKSLASLEKYVAKVAIWKKEIIHAAALENKRINLLKKVAAE